MKHYQTVIDLILSEQLNVNHRMKQITCWCYAKDITTIDCEDCPFNSHGKNHNCTIETRQQTYNYIYEKKDHPELFI